MSYTNHYEVTVESIVDEKRFREFRALEIDHLESGHTRIIARMIEQEELFALINKIGALNLVLLSLKKI